MLEFELGPFESVADRVYVAVAEPATVNVGLVVGSKGAVVIDTGSSPAQGAAILAQAREIAGEVPIVGVIITHGHFDHWFGLAAFDGIPSYGHASLSPQETDDQRDVDCADLEVPPCDLRRPTDTFLLAKTLDLGDCRLECVHFGPGHSPADVVVFVPERQVVFTGDLTENGAPVQVGEDSNLAEWPRTLDGVLGTLRKGVVVVPGHGEPSDHMFAVLQRGTIAGIYQTLEDLYGRGVTVEHVFEQGSWPQGWDEETVEEVADLVFSQFRAAGKKPGRHLPVV